MKRVGLRRDIRGDRSRWQTLIKGVWGLKALIEAAEIVKREARAPASHGVVYAISDELGVAIAKKSILDFFFDKFGKVIGAKRLATLATRNLAPEMSIWALTRP